MFTAASVAWHGGRRCRQILATCAELRKDDEHWAKPLPCGRSAPAAGRGGRGLARAVRCGPVVGRPGAVHPSLRA